MVGRGVADGRRRGRAFGEGGLGQLKAARWAEEVLGGGARYIYGQVLEFVREGGDVRGLEFFGGEFLGHGDDPGPLVGDPAVAEAPAQADIQHAGKAAQGALRIGERGRGDRWFTWGCRYC